MSMEQQHFGDYRDYERDCGCPLNWFEERVGWCHSRTDDEHIESITKNGEAFWFHVPTNQAHEATAFLNSYETAMDYLRAFRAHYVDREPDSGTELFERMVDDLINRTGKVHP